MSFTYKLNECWCDNGEFQAPRLPYAHVITICSYCHLDLTTFVSPVYTPSQNLQGLWDTISSGFKSRLLEIKAYDKNM